MDFQNSTNYYCIDQLNKIDLDYEKLQIQQNLDLLKGVSIKFYSMPPEIEILVKHTLHCILEKFDKQEGEDTIFNIIFESIVNGLKANAKKLFFAEQGFDINNDEDYSKGMLLFKKNLTKLNFKDATGINKDKKLYVQISFTFSADGLEVEILNNTLILEKEEARIREKLYLGGKYNDLMSYYMDCSDSTEGEGLGLVLSLILLKAIGIDPSLFRVGKRGNHTFARIEIPFNDTFESKRKQTI